jgi:FkbM family methyltransferase
MLSNGDTVFLRSAYDFDASTLEEVIYRDIYEREYRIGPGDVVMDVGAHIGSFTMKAAKEVGPTGTVTSFEPSSENFRLLKQNVEANSYKNTRLFNVAVGSQPGTAQLILHKRRGMNSIYTASNDKPVGIEDVPVRTLDDVAQELGLSKVNFLKIDAEGAELEVIKGATTILSSYRPSIAMETHDFGPSKEEIARFLAPFGYGVKETPYHAHLGLLYATSYDGLSTSSDSDGRGEKGSKTG